MPNLLETFTSYVPALTLRRLAANPTPISAPIRDEFPAVVLFADISGFTALTEHLVKRDDLGGAEELSRLLNDYFDQLIALITEHGGDVVKFAGDALLALWTDHDLASATLRAAQCALVAQKELHNYQALDNLRLAMRLSIGVGEVATMHLGGVFGRWEFLLAGDPVIQASRAERQAQPGEIVLSPEAWRLVERACRGTILPAGGVRLDQVRDSIRVQPLAVPELDGQVEGALRAYIPGAILARLIAGQGGTKNDSETNADWLAELRRVTVLFINLPDLNHSLPLAQAQTLMSTLQTALYRYEGSVNKLSVDEKGVMLVAALGLPPLAHEDDAVRATLVALNIEHKLRAMGVRTSIGVTTGQVFCGTIGSPARREYTMIGDTVNVAARLMQAAQDKILCSGPTYQAAQTRVAFEELPAITVKGKTEPIPVYSPTSEKKAALRPQTEIVGRFEERASLAEGMQMLLRGGMGINVFIIEGDAGIGKSRLVDDVRRQADALGVTTLAGVSDPVEKSTLYYAWRPIFSQLLGLELFTDGEKLRRHLRLALGTRLARLAPLLRDVLGIEFPDNETTSQMQPQVRAEATRSLLVQLLQESITRLPKVLILEDAHWLDSSSWALALAVSQHVRPLMLVIATRPLAEPLSAEYQQLIKAGNVRRLKLDSLAADEALALVCLRLGVTTLPETISHLIRQKAEGNPFFSEELAYALRDTGLIQVVDGECRIAPQAGDLRSLQFPDTVQGVITSRIDRLAPSHQMALKVASVIGRVFAFYTLLNIHPIESDKEHLGEYIKALEQLDLTPQEAPEPNLAYIFKHIITQEVAYNLMLFSQRRELHRAVADWLERSHSHDLLPLYPVLAHHWSRAEQWSKAHAFAILAGDTAARLSAFPEARVHYAAALEALEHLPSNAENLRHRIDAVVKQVSVSWVSGQPDEHLARLTEAETSLRTLATAPDSAEPSNDRLRLARIHYWMGRAHYLRNAPREAIGYYQQVLSVALELGDEELIAIPSSFIGQAMLIQGQNAKAVRFLGQAVRPLERAGNWLEWIRTVGFLGCAMIARGDYMAGLAQARQGYVRGQEMRHITGITLSRIYIGFAHMLSRDHAQMLEESRAIVNEAEQAGDRLLLYIGLGYRAWVEGRLGQIENAWASLALSRETGASIGGRLILIDWFAAAAAEIALNGGDYERAISLAEEAVNIAKPGGGIFAQGMAQRIWGSALTQLGPAHWDAAAEHLAASLAACEAGEGIIEAAHTHLAWAKLCQARGDQAAAQEYVGRANAQFATSVMPWLLNEA